MLCKCVKRMFVVVMTLVMLAANVNVVAAAESVGIVESDGQLDLTEGKLSGSDDQLILQDELVTPENQATLVDAAVVDEPNDESGDTPDDKAEHEHIWSTDWACDAMHHWHECKTEECDVTENDQKDGYEEHCYGDGAICAECGCSETGQNDENDEPLEEESAEDDFAVHEHDWLTEWACDEDYHWHECTAKDCTVTENNEKDGYAEHELNEDGAGCVECGYLAEVEEEAPEHKHIFSSEWASDEFCHWHECEAEGCLIVEDDEKDGYDEHVYFDEDESWFGDELICRICGYDATELFAMLGEMGLYTEYTKPPVNLPATPARSYKEAYDRIVAAMNDYPEGLRWTSYEPYSPIDPYMWQTWVRIDGYGKVNRGVGCAGFAFLMSDLAFKDLPARVYSTGQFKLEDVKVGDIIRYDTGRSEHVVIVLQVSDGGVIVTEGNYNSSVHWGRVLTREQVESAYYYITRWPEGFVDPDAGDADAVVNSGTDGGLNWQVTKGGVLTISGTGAMPDYALADSKSTAPWSVCNVLSVIIEEGITSIGAYAFYNSNVLNVYIPEGVTAIGRSAFEESTLVSVTIPGSTKTISKSAFAYCGNLVSASISDGVVTVGEQAFRGCEIKYIDFPATIESVGAGAFMSCQQVTQVRFAPGTKKVAMGDNMFSQCWYLSSVLLPEGADRISAGMFESCSRLKKICVPKGVSEIGDMAFTQCPYLSLEGNGIFFEGSEQQWNDIGGKAMQIWTQPHVANVYFNQTFDNPFVVDPNAADMIGEGLCVGGHTGTADADGNCSVCGKPMGTMPVEPTPNVHEHKWSGAWTWDEGYHWHECTANDCSVSANDKKDSYAVHSYSDEGICTVCGYAKAGSENPSTPVEPNPERPKKPDVPEKTKPAPTIPINRDESDSRSAAAENELQNQWPGLFASLGQPDASTNNQEQSQLADWGLPITANTGGQISNSLIEAMAPELAENADGITEQELEQEQASEPQEGLDQTQTMGDGSNKSDTLDMPSDARRINVPIAIAAAATLIGILMYLTLARFNHRLESNDSSYDDSDGV